MELKKTDIFFLAHTFYSEDDCLVCVCPYDKSGIQPILLREILKTFGDYSILSSKDFDNKDNKRWYQKTVKTDTEYITNLPYFFISSLATK